MNIPNKDKVILKDMDAEEIKGLFVAEDIEWLNSDGFWSTAYSNTYSSRVFNPESVYRTKPKSIQQQLESEIERVCEVIKNDYLSPSGEFYFLSAEGSCDLLSLIKTINIDYQDR